MHRGFPLVGAVLLSGMVLVMGVDVAHAENDDLSSFVGRWQIDLNRTHLNRGNIAARAATFTFVFKTSAQGITLDTYAEYPLAEPTRSNLIIPDGKQHRCTTPSGCLTSGGNAADQSYAYFRIDSHLLVRVFYIEDKIVEYSTYSVSSNGNTFTMIAWGAESPEKQNIQVFDKQPEPNASGSQFLVLEYFDPATGHSAEFEKWWSTHFEKILLTPGVSSVDGFQKAAFQLRRPSAATLPEHLAAYYVNVDNLDDSERRIRSVSASPNLAIDAKSARIFVYRKLRSWTSVGTQPQGESFRQLVFANATPGREEEFNHWYDDLHAQDILSVPGVVVFQRFVFADAITAGAELPPKYISMMDFKTDSLEKFSLELDRMGSRSPNPGAFDGAHAWRMLYKRIESRLAAIPSQSGN